MIFRQKTVSVDHYDYDRLIRLQIEDLGQMQGSKIERED